MITSRVIPSRIPSPSVGVATTSMVRSEGRVIRYNMGWTLVLLGYLVLIGLLYYYVLPDAMRP